MDEYKSTEDALHEICRTIYVLDKEEEFNQSTHPEFNPAQHVLLNRKVIESLFSMRSKTKLSFPARDL